MELKEKASYIIGLLEGSKLDFGKEKNKIIDLVLSLIKDMANKIEKLESVCFENTALIDELDKDLTEVEETLAKREYECYGECGKKNSVKSNRTIDYYDTEEADSEEGFEDEEDFEKEEPYEVSCSNCKRVFEIGEEVFKNNDIICPECGDKIIFEFKENEEKN